MKRTVWIAAVVVAVANGAAVASTCPAFMWLGTGSKERDTFFFGASGTCEAIDVFSISVGPLDEREPTCEVHALSPTTTRVFESGWRYGAVPDGFVERRKCEPLKPGGTYWISVVGTCNGTRYFRVDKRGHLKITSSLKGADRRCGPAAPPGHL
jgi:hypothetical protein